MFLDRVFRHEAQKSDLRTLNVSERAAAKAQSM